MNILSFRSSVAGAFRKSAGGTQILFEPYRDYLVTNHQAERLVADPGVQGQIFRMSYADMRLPNFQARAERTGESVLLFNGGGGYGDQILTWPVASILSQWYDVHILAEPGNNTCWWHLPFVQSVQTVPLQWSTLRLYKNTALFEYVANRDEHPDQEHPVDAMLRKIGLDPARIPDAQKVVAPTFGAEELRSTQPWLEKSPRIGLYQLSSANSVRALGPEDSVFLLTKLAEAYPAIHWLGLYDEFNPAAYADLLKAQIQERQLTNVEASCFSNLRELWALTQVASVVVAPDSMMVHIAGSLGTPCVGLWGPVHPNRRVRYYARHTPIFPAQYCPLAPCHTYGATFPRYCPPKPGGRKTCEVLAGIVPEQVVETVGRVAR